MNSDRIWLAQSGGSPDGTEVFEDSNTLADALRSLDSGQIIRASGTRITVPASDEIFAATRSDGAEVSNDDLITMTISSREQIALSDAIPMSTLSVAIDVDPEDYKAFIENGNTVPKVTLKSNNSLVYDRIPNLESPIEISEQNPNINKEFPFRIEISQSEPSPILAQRNDTDAQIVVFFEGLDYSISFPVGISGYGVAQ